MLSSSFNSFTRRFTSVFEPVTPVCSLNALAISSPSGPSVVPSGWTLFSGTVSFINDGIRKYFRFPSDVVENVLRFNQPNVMINYGDGNGATYILVVRLNATNVPIGTIMTSSLIAHVPNPGSITGLMPIQAINGDAVLPLGPAGNTKAVCPHRTTTIGKNRFIFVAHTLTNGATTPTVVTYLDGKRIGVTTSGFTNLTNITTASTAYTSCRNGFTGGGATLDHDLMYYAHYSRPLSDNDIKRVFNSIAPVMETAAPLYTTVTPFTSISVPSAPLFEFNAFGYTQTNGQSYVAGTSGWVGNGVQSLNWSVDGVGRRYLNFNTNNATLTKSYTVSSSMFTNQGYSFVLLVRLNQFTNGGQNALFSTALAKFYLNYEYSSSSSGQFVVPTFLYLTASSTLGGQQNADMADTSSFQTNKFMLLSYVVSGSVASIYINNVRMTFKTVTPVGSGGNQASFATTATIGLQHQGVLGPVTNNIDVSYMSFHDRPLNTTEMTTLYNSVAMLLD